MTPEIPNTTVPNALEQLVTSRRLVSKKQQPSMSKFNRQFARRKWKKELGDMFMFRGKMAPSFRTFIKTFKNENVQKAVQRVQSEPSDGQGKTNQVQEPSRDATVLPLKGETVSYRSESEPRAWPDASNVS
jgi:hypothetical protein